MSDFWQQIDHGLDRIETERPATFDAVKAILDAHGNPDGYSDQTPTANSTFFGGSGGDRQLFGALRAAGWGNVRWHDAPYYYTLRSPDGTEHLTYIEGDVVRGEQS